MTEVVASPREYKVEASPREYALSDSPREYGVTASPRDYTVLPEPGGCRVLSEGYQGPRGAIGLPGGLVRVEGVLSVAVPAGTPLRVVPGSGRLAPADGRAVATSRVAGLAAADGVPNFTVGVERSLLTLDDWTAVAGVAALTPGAWYYLDPLTPGRLTADLPAAPLVNTLVGEGGTDPATMLLILDHPIQL